MRNWTDVRDSDLLPPEATVITDDATEAFPPFYDKAVQSKINARGKEFTYPFLNWLRSKGMCGRRDDLTGSSYGYPRMKTMEAGP